MSETLNYWTQERMKNAIPMTCYCENDDNISSDNDEILSVEKADISKMPYSAGGKLFFRINGKDYVASAEFCAHKQIILTAAHCLYDRQTELPSTKIMFHRCYDEGKQE